MDKYGLKPCPFCGGEAAIQNFNITPNCKGRIICSCGAEMRVGANETVDDIVIVWNTRAERTCRIVKSVPDDRMWVYRHEFACECGQKNLFTIECEPPNYCPNCGAKVAD